MEILAAYDLTGSYRKAAELAGCDHHTVRRCVQLRGTGVDPSARTPRSKILDAFMPKIEELVEASRGKIGADQGTRSSWRWDTPASTAPRAGLSPRPRRPTRQGAAGCTARG